MCSSVTPRNENKLQKLQCFCKKVASEDADTTFVPEQPRYFNTHFSRHSAHVRTTNTNRQYLQRFSCLFTF